MDYNARWYDAALGRFISADTVVPGTANPQARNRYAYMGNNPIRFNDPSGHRLTTGCEVEFGTGCNFTASELQKYRTWEYQNIDAPQCRAGNSNKCSGWRNQWNDIVKGVKNLKKTLDEAGDAGEPGYDQYDLDQDYFSYFFAKYGPEASGQYAWLQQHLRSNPEEIDGPKLALNVTSAGLEFIPAIGPLAEADFKALSGVADTASIGSTLEEIGNEGLTIGRTIDLGIGLASFIPGYGVLFNVGEIISNVGGSYYFDLSGY